MVNGIKCYRVVRGLIKNDKCTQVTEATKDLGENKFNGREERATRAE